MPRLLVVGSVNYDLVFRHRRLPGPGETVIGAEMLESCGGKGANQAVAAARCARALASGAASPLEVEFGGAIGDDAFGRAQRRVLEGDGIRLPGLLVVPSTPTGTSAVWVEASTGQNRILNAPGANATLTPESAERLAVESAHLLLLQNEIPAPTTERLARRARAAGVTVVWNPAPVSPETAALGPELVDFLTPNEVEAGALLGAPVDLERPATAAAALRALGWRRVVITLGAGGAVLDDGEQVLHVPAPRVEAVDTTGAGDAFNGAFVAALLDGRPAPEAVRIAVAYASDSVQRPGVQSSFGDRLPELVAG